MILYKRINLLIILLIATLVNGYGQAIANTLFIKAENYYYTGNKEKALFFYNKAIEQDSNFVAAYSNRGLLKWELKDYSGALKDFKKVIVLAPNSADIYNNIAIVNIDQGDYIGALAMCNKALSIDSVGDMVVAYGNRARAKHGLKQYKSAIKDYNYLALQMPMDHEIYYRRSLSKYALGDTLGCLVDLKKAIQLNRFYVNAYIEKGNVELDLGEDKEAIKTFSKIRKLTTDKSILANAYGQVGSIYSSQGNYKKALKNYNLAIIHHPQDPFIYLSRGILFLEQKELRLALEDCNKALNLESQLGDAYFMRATIYKELGNLSKACLDWANAQKYGVKEAEIAIVEYCTKN